MSESSSTTESTDTTKMTWCGEHDQHVKDCWEKHQQSPLTNAIILPCGHLYMIPDPYLPHGGVDRPTCVCGKKYLIKREGKGRELDVYPGDVDKVSPSQAKGKKQP